ncbi:endonuclease YncB(thermonuclease family) [Bartonella silvatica]|uniref:Endonuclease YncB(Thermonuclease family) n=1 Tax=Bartonella silvatica TaxID=357760 RepID=A0ABV2HI80_9HYPH
MKKNFFYFDRKMIGVSTLAAFTIFIVIAVYFKYTQEKSSSFATSIKGYATIIDGDSIVISSTKIRLIGIDAPELQQFCGKKKTRYPCGLEAKKYLEQLVDNQLVTCHWNKKDKYHRILATCKTQKISNINATLVRDGWAVSYYSYPKEEEEARKKKKGIWQSNFQKPRKWRKAHPRTE